MYRTSNLSSSSDSEEKTLVPTHLLYWRSKTKRDWVFLALEFVVVVALCFSLSYVFSTPYCGALFRCGCTWIWAGGSDKCNVHNPTGPHCPWCTAPPFLRAFPKLVTPVFDLIVTGGLIYRFPQRRLVIYAIVPVAFWLVFNLIYGAIMRSAYDYPYFLWSNTTKGAL